jgi:hypothetical protein
MLSEAPPLQTLPLQSAASLSTVLKRLPLSNHSPLKELPPQAPLSNHSPPKGLPLQTPLSNHRSLKLPPLASPKSSPRDKYLQLYMLFPLKEPINEESLQLYRNFQQFCLKQGFLWKKRCTFASISTSGSVYE